MHTYICFERGLCKGVHTLYPYILNPEPQTLNNKPQAQPEPLNPPQGACGSSCAVGGGSRRAGLRVDRAREFCSDAPPGVPF